MPLLRSHDVLSPDALRYTEEFWWKAGLLMFMKERCPKIAHMILEWIYVPWKEITRSKIIQVYESLESEVSLLRPTHPDDVTAYIWRLVTREFDKHNIAQIKMLSESSIDTPESLFKNSIKDLWWYIERLWCRGIENFTGLYWQPKMKKMSYQWSIVEHPHQAWNFVVSCMFWPDHKTWTIVNKDGLIVSNPNLGASLSREEAKFLIEAYHVSQESWWLAGGITGQMEFGYSEANNNFCIFQFRAFREKEIANWWLDEQWNESMVFGITPPEWIECKLQQLSYQEFVGWLGGDTWVFRYGNRNSIHPDIPLEQLPVFISPWQNAATLEHWFYEPAASSNVAIIGSQDFMEQGLQIDDKYWELSRSHLYVRIFADGYKSKVDILD